jgi:uncharacterized protein YndB with AHSA1/START domain
MQIEKTIELKASASAVWDALTNPDLTKRYLFGCEAISDWKVVSPVSFSTESDGKRTVHVKGIIIAFAPNRCLAHTCVGAGFERNSRKQTTVTYALSTREDVTELSVTQRDFSDDW